MRMNMKCYRIAILLLGGVALFGCSGDDLGDLRTYVEDVKTKNPGKIKPLPEVTPLEGFRYGAVELKDPFKQTFTSQLANAAKGSGIQGPDLNRKRQALENHPLDSLNFMGSMKRGGEQWAIIKSPSGELVRVQPGDYMGQNFGKIIKIMENGLELREMISDGLGGWEERLTKVGLSE